MRDGYLPRLRWRRHHLGYLKAAFWGVARLACPCGVGSAGQGWRLLCPGWAGQWGMGPWLSPLCCARFQNQVPREGDTSLRCREPRPARGGKSTSTLFCSACLVLTNFEATLYNGIRCFHTFPTWKPAALHWQLSLAFTTKMSHFAVA